MALRPTFLIIVFAAIVPPFSLASESGQLLEHRLLKESPAELARAARETGDAQRGAILFHQQWLTCTKCHAVSGSEKPLGPNLADLDKNLSDKDLVESVLQPSKTIRKGYETTIIETSDGQAITGLVQNESDQELMLRDPSTNKTRTFSLADIESRESSPQSIMPTGLVNQMASRQQFIDLLSYLLAIRDGGAAKARELQPLPSQYASQLLPEYEARVDHAGIIADLDDEAYERGEAIYNRLCINCHGTKNRAGSLPTSLRFASGRFKNGSDPYSMYQTLTRGFGLMVGQRWMVPQQKYDVIHYIREHYLRGDNPSEFFTIDDNFLASLPAGDTRGPAPSTVLPWEQMDYGPNLIATYEVGKDGQNFAYKGNAIRLDQGPGGVSQGSAWLIYDLDTLRVAAAWTGNGFIDWNGINFNGRHGVHPRVVGDVLFQNPTGPGWANPEDSTFQDTRLRGRDERIYGPLPRQWAHYKGMYYHGSDTIIKYTVDGQEILEMPSLASMDGHAIVKRHIALPPTSRELILQVASLPKANTFRAIAAGDDKKLIVSEPPDSVEQQVQPSAYFDGETYISVDAGGAMDFRRKDYTVTARVKTKEDGTIFAETSDGESWVPNGKTLFIRDGRLCFDIGWVGAIVSRKRVNDGKWHSVAAVFDSRLRTITLFIDGARERSRRLAPEDDLEKPVVRLGYTAGDFPAKPFFEGSIEEIRFYQRRLSVSELSRVASRQQVEDDKLIANWRMEDAQGLVEQANREFASQVRRGGSTASSRTSRGALSFTMAGDVDRLQWRTHNQNLRISIPPSVEPRRFTIYHVADLESEQIQPLAASIDVSDARLDFESRLLGGPKRWPEEIKTIVQIGQDAGPFAVDVLTHPTDNPWFCRMRLTAFDFFDDGDSAAVADWDGNVWLVQGLSQLPTHSKSGKATPELTWRRIASGLFQPLGLRIVKGQIFVNCRDQICILHDLNADGEIDLFENFNNDHQVTDHFHEFAMGLQTDDEGNFYYAKSARHALTALVPHHGTLLKVSRDGQETEILATGFRAANGVCVNPDGTFFVTDQEGHWNPKNRINWVKRGGFYGNMFGYHDVTDSSDSAMEPPLCWITNDFDRSPAELLWVNSERWGPLNGTLLNLSYGYGKVFVVPHQKKGGRLQGGMCELPIPQFPTGTIRGRFCERDGQLYMSGMFAWAGNQQQNGGFYRLRYTGKPVYLPIGLDADRKTLSIRFSGELDPKTVDNVENFAVKSWSLRRTAQYGSDHYNTRSLDVSRASLSGDRRTVVLEIPDLAPTWCMEIRYTVIDQDGSPIDGRIHNTIHSLD